MKSALFFLQALAATGAVAVPFEQAPLELPVDKTVKISGLTREQQGRMFLVTASSSQPKLNQVQISLKLVALHLKFKT
jgi:hypothetical protein